MAARPTWKGFLKVSLVNIPVKVFPATESSATLSFNQLHAECQTRIQQKRWCPHCEREVPNTELVKGYEFEKGRYVVVTDDDIQKVRVESTRVINLVQFADDSEIDPIYVDRAYYLAPDGPVAADAFAVMRDGMTGKAGIGKMALYGREYLVAVRPKKKGFVTTPTVRHPSSRASCAITGLASRSLACATNIARPLGMISAKLPMVHGSTCAARRRTGRPRVNPSRRRSSTAIEPTSRAMPTMWTISTEG